MRDECGEVGPGFFLPREGAASEWADDDEAVIDALRGQQRRRLRVMRGQTAQMDLRGQGRVGAEQGAAKVPIDLKLMSLARPGDAARQQPAATFMGVADSAQAGDAHLQCTGK